MRAADRRLMADVSKMSAVQKHHTDMKTGRQTLPARFR
jgi:hypothetical protein